MVVVFISPRMVYTAEAAGKLAKLENDVAKETAKQSVCPHKSCARVSVSISKRTPDIAEDAEISVLLENVARKAAVLWTALRVLPRSAAHLVWIRKTMPNTAEAATSLACKDLFAYKGRAFVLQGRLFVVVRVSTSKAMFVTVGAAINPVLRGLSVSLESVSALAERPIVAETASICM